MKTKLVLLLRRLRVLHKWVGIPLAFFFILISFTGLLLGWKKNSDTIQPPTLSGSNQNVSGWLALDTLCRRAELALDSLSIGAGSIDRLEVRFDKGIIKVLFSEGYWEVQVDPANGKIKSVAQRHSDWIEHLHDGSLISEIFKLGYTSTSSIGLLILACSGVYLWYGPKVIRRNK